MHGGGISKATLKLDDTQSFQERTMADVNMDQIVDQLSHMTVMQIAQLTKLLEDKWGVKAAPVAVAGPAQGGLAQAQEKPAEQTEFTVVLTGAGANKIGVIK